MKSRTSVVALTLVAVLATACGGGDDPAEDVSPTAATSPAPTGQEPTPEPTLDTASPTAAADTVAITITGGEPEEGIARPEFELGDQVRIEVTSTDTTDHVHVHGYDLFADLAPGETAVIEFTAEIPGQFEVELEDSHTKIAELVVRG
ncbi:MAG: hypothetical protein R3320_01150 [Nitriliruptorales bacterium]|nr:hypothetical protein [Nitriliruptorales bacterium]